MAKHEQEKTTGLAKQISPENVLGFKDTTIGFPLFNAFVFLLTNRLDQSLPER